MPLASAELATPRMVRGRLTLDARIRDLHPGSFAFVMATGIVSTGEEDAGVHWLSFSLLVVAMAGYAVLCVLFAIRLLRFPSELWADTARPERAFGFFTFVAGRPPARTGASQP